MVTRFNFSMADYWWYHSSASDCITEAINLAGDPHVLV